MKLNVYSSEIIKYMNKILEARGDDIEATLSYCEKLLAYGEEHNDSYLLGFAYYYMGDAYYFLGDTNKQIAVLYSGLEHLKISENYDLTARAYNLLGITYNTQGNLNASLDYYLQGLNICNSYNLSYVSGMICSNISILFNSVGNHEKAIEFIQRALNNYLALESTQNVVNNLTATYLALGQTYLCLDKLAEATECMKKIDSYLPQVPADYIGISAAVFKAMLAHSLGFYDDRDAYVQEIAAISLQKYSLLSFYDDLMTLVHFLLDIGKYTALLEIVEHMDTLAAEDQNYHIQLELTKIKLSYYQQTQQDFLFLHSARRFYELLLQQEAENKKIMSDAIDLRFSLQEMQNKNKKMMHENEKLVLQSESDALTGLPNRYKLDSYADALLSRALQNHLPLTVEILDIDYFKQYNDTYGHQAGDNCLVAIAKALHSMMNENVFCARYGGDEFIIIYYNKTAKEVRQLAENLKQTITDLNIEHKGSLAAPYVTITQGLVTRIPKTGNRMWDFLHVADTALYEGKKQEKNTIVHEIIE